jgi:hypothetical protein
MDETTVTAPPKMVFCSTHNHDGVSYDNGIVELLHVRTALPRKNVLFAGSAGGERAAIIWVSAIESRLTLNVAYW